MDIEIRRKRIIDIVLSRKEIRMILAGSYVRNETVDLDDEGLYSVCISCDMYEKEENEEKI